MSCQQQKGELKIGTLFFFFRQHGELSLGQVETQADVNRTEGGKRKWAQTLTVSKSSVVILVTGVSLSWVSSRQSREAKQDAGGHQNKQHFLFL